MQRMVWLGFVSGLWLWPIHAGAQAAASGKVIETQLTSRHLQVNLVGIDPQRSIRIYLPPDYDRSNRRYPVIYYFHSLFWSNRQMFEDGGVQKLFDTAISDGTIRSFILVAGDFTTPQVGTFFGNAPATGGWLDFIVDELVPFVDTNFRTLATPGSRGLAGDFLGGYVALKLAMLYPDRFSTIYALHPVGTGSGLMPMTSRPDWRKMNLAKSWADLRDDPFSQVFMAMSQAFLPNPARPPFYCDLMVELKKDDLVVNTDHVRTLQSRFLLDQLLPEHAANLKKMTAIALDWGRYDTNQDHVASNQAFTRKLEEYGIEHFAEEYRGNQWEKNWIEHGRVQDEMLPFFDRFMDFGTAGSRSGNVATPQRQ